MVKIVDAIQSERARLLNMGKKINTLYINDYGSLCLKTEIQFGDANIFGKQIFGLVIERGHILISGEWAFSINGHHVVAERNQLDTSQLGPIKVEPDKTALRAKIVRDALLVLANDSNMCQPLQQLHLFQVVQLPDEVLSKLHQLIKVR